MDITILHRIGLLGLLLMGLGLPQAVAQDQELPLGSTLPMAGATVQAVDGSSVQIGSLTGRTGTVFVFWSNQCPWVDKYQDRLRALHGTYSSQGINFVLVNANDPEAFPQEAASIGQGQNHPMAYIMDAGSAFAQALGASRTPHIFAFDGSKTLVYVGTIDDSPGDPGNVQNTYLQDALGAMVQGSSPGVSKTKAFGCRIKFQGS